MTCLSRWCRKRSRKKRRKSPKRRANNAARVSAAKSRPLPSTSKNRCRRSSQRPRPSLFSRTIVCSWTKNCSKRASGWNFASARAPPVWRRASHRRRPGSDAIPQGSRPIADRRLASPSRVAVSPRRFRPV
uniref:(northern house mosquito) hypothetical protein n=1 Tax=Culex pipiens TaxID=7175 RepID=A0A8D8FE11_CULPI